jgi:hypothetical protein
MRREEESPLWLEAPLARGQVGDSRGVWEQRSPFQEPG